MASDPGGLPQACACSLYPHSPAINSTVCYLCSVEIKGIAACAQYRAPPARRGTKGLQPYKYLLQGLLGGIRDKQRKLQEVHEPRRSLCFWQCR